MKRLRFFGLIVVAVSLALSGCATLAVTAPSGMFVSTGDYVPNVRTLGIVQAKKTVFAPLFITDVNSIHQQLYNELIKRAQAAGGDGLTNISFNWAISPLTYFTFYIASGVFDYYIEGVAIKR